MMGKNISNFRPEIRYKELGNMALRIPGQTLARPSDHSRAQLCASTNVLKGANGMLLDVPIRVPAAINPRFSRLAVLLVLLWFAVACNRSSPPSPAVAHEPKQTQTPATGADHSDQTKPEGEAVQREVKPTATSDGAGAESSIPAAKVVSRERIVLFAPGGPLLIDMNITIDGQPLDAAVDEMIDEVLRLADTNSDGNPTWDELVECPRFVYGQFGNAPINTPAQRRQVLETYDADRDNRVDRGEVAPFLTQDMAGTGAFTLTSSNQFRDENRSRSPVWKWLDQEENGVLSSAEIAQAPLRLRLRDADNDDLVYAVDFKTADEVMSDRLMAASALSRRGFGPDSAMVLGPKANWDLIAASLQELYAYDRQGAEDPTPLVPGLLPSLDKNENGRLDAVESRALTEIEPHLALAAEFRRDQPHASTLGLVSIARDLRQRAQLVQSQPQRTLVALPGVRLAFFLSDAAPNAEFKSRAEQLLSRYDQDNNGYLDPEEVPAASGELGVPFEAVDIDQDGKIYAGEIETLLRQQQSARMRLIRVHASDDEDALLAALDTNGDARLTAREITGASDRLRSLDQNGDGQLAASEVPGAMSVGFLRGSLGRQDVPRRHPLTTHDYQTDTPPWFAHMDQNGDGDVSGQEFSGTPEQFRQLDADSDQFLDQSEAIQATTQHDRQR